MEREEIQRRREGKATGKAKEYKSPGREAQEKLESGGHPTRDDGVCRGRKSMTLGNFGR